jgi:hypothetical protein
MLKRAEPPSVGPVRSIWKKHVLQVPGSGPIDLHYGKNSYIRTLERRVLERVPLTAAPVRVCERKVAPVTSVTEIEKKTEIARMHSQIKISVAAPQTLLG